MIAMAKWDTSGSMEATKRVMEGMGQQTLDVRAFMRSSDPLMKNGKTGLKANCLSFHLKSSGGPIMGAGKAGNTELKKEAIALIHMEKLVVRPSPVMYTRALAPLLILQRSIVWLWTKERRPCSRPSIAGKPPCGGGSTRAFSGGM